MAHHPNIRQVPQERAHWDTDSDKLLAENRAKNLHAVRLGSKNYNSRSQFDFPL